MKKIYKYKLMIVDEQIIPTFENARVRHVGLDPFGSLCMWCEVDPQAPSARLHVYVVGTGHEIPAGARVGDYVGHDWYRGSVLDGSVVWHVYAREYDRKVPV
jgi:hypothetical protein